jgi:cobalamin biosynthesis protein CobD/CbiB
MMTDMVHTLRRGPRAGILRAALNNPDLLPAPTESVGQSWGKAALGAPAWAKPPTSPEAALGTALTVDVGGRIVYAGRGQPQPSIQAASATSQTRY